MITAGSIVIDLKALGIDQLMSSSVSGVAGSVDMGIFIENRVCIIKVYKIMFGEEKYIHFC